MGESFKIGIFSDTHVGRSIPRVVGDKRREAFKHAFSQAIDVFIREGVDYVLHSGDLFERRSMRPEDTAFVKKELQRLIDAISELYRKRVNIVVVRGNHDGTSENSALDYVWHPLAEYFHVVGEDEDGGISTFFDQQICVAGLGYTPFAKKTFSEKADSIKKALSRGSFKVLLLHAFVEGHHPIPPGTPEYSTISASQALSVGADLVVCGHYHGHLDPAEKGGSVLLTPGGTDAIDLGDKGPFGVYIAEVEGGALQSLRFVELKPLQLIKSVKVSSEGAVWGIQRFVEKALAEVRSFAEQLKFSEADGILRVVLDGRVDGDDIDLRVAVEREAFKHVGEKGLLYVEVDCRASPVSRELALPAVPEKSSFLQEAFSPLGELVPEAMKLVSDVEVVLDERASTATGLLTDRDRDPFVKRWVKILEEAVEHEQRN